MGIKGAIKRLAERVTGTHILKSLPRGVNLFNDVALAFPGYLIDTVFDVGANVGQSAIEYAKAMPLSKIYSIEPVAKTFEKLKTNTRSLPQVHCIQVAFGASAGEGIMLSNETSKVNHLISSEFSRRNIDLPVEQVTIDTLENFCERAGINRISYLKIDTEGADMDVLKGAGILLTQQRIDLIQLEAGMNPSNEYHVPFAVLNDYLDRHGYLLFGVYDQVHEWPTQRQHLRRTNPVFISSLMIEKYRQKIAEEALA